MRKFKAGDILLQIKRNKNFIKDYYPHIIRIVRIATYDYHYKYIDKSVHNDYIYDKSFKELEDYFVKISELSKLLYT